jgi:hypothetical protein
MVTPQRRLAAEDSGGSRRGRSPPVSSLLFLSIPHGISLSFFGEWSGRRREVGGAIGGDPCSHVSGDSSSHGSRGNAAAFPGSLEGDDIPVEVLRTRGGVPVAASRARDSISRGTLDDVQRPS